MFNVHCKFCCCQHKQIRLIILTFFVNVFFKVVMYFLEFGFRVSTWFLINLSNLQTTLNFVVFFVNKIRQLTMLLKANNQGVIRALEDEGKLISHE